MGPELQAHVAFHLTGKRLGGGLETPERASLRPALLAPFAELARLRHDFPLVLADECTGPACVQSLTAIVNAALQSIAPRGDAGERTRQHVLRLERAIRALACNGTSGRLSALWDAAAQGLLASGDAQLKADLDRARAVLAVDGEVVDCTGDLPERLVTHAFRCVQSEKAARFGIELARLSLGLARILQADFERSAAGRSPARLAASVGSALAEEFDFDALAGVLAGVTDRNPLPAVRRARIERALAVLEAAHLHAGLGGSAAAAPFGADDYIFDSCRAASDAFRRRLPELIELVRAIAIAELETEGRYQDGIHDAFFADFDESSVGASDLALFPDYLVRLRTTTLHGSDGDGLMELLASGIPVKVLVQASEILEEPSLREGHAGFFAPSAQVARTALGLEGVYVLQTAGSSLYSMRRQVMRGLEEPGPALISVFTGAIDQPGALPPYLVAAAALESRAFPTFTLDPAAGPDLASRFSLENNPQPDADWPVHELRYEDAARLAVTEPVAFTFADFVACDARYARHFAVVPSAQWNGSMVPVGRAVDPALAAAGQVPYVTLAGADGVLQRALVDEKLTAAARRCREVWHGLQETAGVHSSQAERLLARERQRWEEEKQREIAALRRDAGAAAAATVAAAAASAPPPAPAAPAAAPAGTAGTAAAPPSDEAWIESVRCTSCNECTNLNNRMFAYDENKQAYIKDTTAGTYRELVEAAESCQVSIIHPGKPRNPAEAGLEELIKRAEPFI